MTNSNNETYGFKANVFIKGKIECTTGLHIGGSKEKLEIGGVDSPVVRNPNTNYPYIPGSSLKGKLRHLLEFATGAILNYESELGSVSISDEIVRLFGIGAGKKDDKKKEILKTLNAGATPIEKIKAMGNLGPSRLAVRDSKPDGGTIKMWKKMDTELVYTELKAENTIDRLTSAANPRSIERVVASSLFDFEIMYTVYKLGEVDYMKSANEDLSNLHLAMSLLEDAALGKSGSRGYGKVKFHLQAPITVYTDDYRTGEGDYENANKALPDGIGGLSPLSSTQFSYNEKKA